MTVNKNYYDDLSKFDGLSEDEAIVLFSKYKAGDYKAFNKIIESHLRLVVHFAKMYRNTIEGDNIIGYDDLINEGNLGLIIAASRFDVTKDIKFSYFARYIIADNGRIG